MLYIRFVIVAWFHDYCISRLVSSIVILILLEYQVFFVVNLTNIVLLSNLRSDIPWIFYLFGPLVMSIQHPRALIIY